METNLLKVLADENRLRIVRHLASAGESCVCDVASAIDASDALVSHHIKRLRDVGLVRTRRVGTWLHCALDPVTLRTLAESAAELADSADRAAGNPCCGCGPAGCDS
ncbi:MAG: metalloregulator ArsR/SmtB family transcription factor [Actinomycetota bacterium]|jgi:ArsR family transcriptional regulator|nr:metalloregulator ArsR/SmtB family transcription factor [Actinomycetota bacterium]MDZ4178059.1 metalloregulator ArsR/SmtB family transcription factor [Coriobacteriia bacterium]